MSPERRKDLIFKTLFLLACSGASALGSWTSVQIAQARLEVRVETMERAETQLKEDMASLYSLKVDREENGRLNTAQDQRIGDIRLELDSIHADIRTLIQMQGGRHG